MIRLPRSAGPCAGLLVLWLITDGRVRAVLRRADNVARTLAGRQATPETIAAINAPARADQPLWKQYLDFVGNALHGDLGYDYYHQVPVTTIIAQALPITLSLVARGRRALAGARASPTGSSRRCSRARSRPWR